MIHDIAAWTGIAVGTPHDWINAVVAVAALALAGMTLKAIVALFGWWR